MVVLNKIYTRTGDKGDTALGDGSRRSKSDPRVDAYGTVDELNATVGVARLPAGPDLFALDREREALASQPSDAPAVDVEVRDRMYVIYTSGSTGRPKGVELEHRSVSNFLSSMEREPGLGEGMSLLAVTTLSFDISVLETMLPLMVGAAVVVAPAEATTNGPALGELLGRGGIGFGYLARQPLDLVKPPLGQRPHQIALCGKEPVHIGL